jgi:hypothetical protein
MIACLCISWMCGTLLAPSGSAQPGTATIVGTVRDPSGAAVPDAAVELENRARGIRRSLKTDSEGAFSLLGLVPATGYRLTVTKAGFSEYVLESIKLQVGEEVNFLVPLTITPARARVSVDESATITGQYRTEVSQVVGNSQILNLPINGRRVDTYVLLTPAVVPDGVAGLVSFRGVAGGNAFLTDGNDTSNQFFNENAGRTRISTQISQDAVQEFQVLTSGYSAEYGHASGGIINTVTRSGSNIWSGTAYLFYRDRSLNARDRYSSVNPPEKRYQGGASLGGAIVKDRLFFFLNGEAHRRDFPLVSSLSRPPLFDAGGAFIGKCDATAQQCGAALQFLRRNFQVLERKANSELAFGKLDWTPSERNQVSASFNYLRWLSPNGFQTQAVLNNGEGVGANGNSSVRTRYARLAWKFVPGGTRINELRLGWLKDRHSDNINPLLAPPETGLVQITVEGQANLGVSAELPRIDPSENRFELADGYSMLSGRHTWKFGAGVIRTQDFVKYLRNRNGSYEYGDFTSFALDFSGNTTGARRWQTYSQRFGNQIFDENIRDYDAYAEDQLRLGPQVSLKLGMRYEYATLPQPSPVNPEFPDHARIPSVKTNLAPRIGLAAGFNGSRDVIRAGYGIFYARYHGGLMSTFFQENGGDQQPVHLEQRFLGDPTFGPVFPRALPAFTGLPSSADPAFSSAIDLTFPSKDYRNPYTHQADLTLEHAFSPSLSVSASYLWSQGLCLTTVRDWNVGPPGAPAYYSVQDAQGNAVGTYSVATYRLVNRINPRWRRVNGVESGGRSYYNALVLQLRQRLYKGIEGFAAYTWSHAIDFNQGGGADNIFFGDGPRSLWNGDYRADKASSQLDQRHRLVVSSTYEPPLTGRTGSVARFLLANWRLSQISTFASAQPATPTILVSGVPFPGAAFNSTLNGFGGSTRSPFDPPSSLDIDRIARTDARITKILRFAGRRQVHVNFEAFNVFNRVSNTSVNTAVYEARNGVLRPLPHLGEGVASQGYPDGTNARRAQVSLRAIW